MCLIIMQTPVWLFVLAILIHALKILKVEKNWIHLKLCFLFFLALGGEFSGLRVALSAEAPVGREGEALPRQHLRRAVSLLLRVPGKHAAISHHSPNRQVQRWRSCCLGVKDWEKTLRLHVMLSGHAKDKLLKLIQSWSQYWNPKLLLKET